VASLTCSFLVTKSRPIVFLSALLALLAPALGSESVVAQPLPGGTLDPTTIPKFVTPLVIPPEMPSSGVLPDGSKYYEIAVRQFQQQILPAGFPITTVWSYGSIQHPGTPVEGGTFHYPAFTIEAAVNEPTGVRWINDLKDPNGNFLSHILPVDPTLHWANPSGPRDTRPSFSETPGPYTGPVPIVVHLHGSHVNPNSDGFPEAWYLPDAANVDCIDEPGYPRTPSSADDFYCKGSNYDSVFPAPKGSAVFQYRNDQRATTLWYHDHSLGLTRNNVYAGPAGFYLLRGGPDDLPSEPEVIGGLPGPAPRIGDRPGTRYYEIPIVIQDRSFNTDSSLFYPDTRAFFDGFEGPYIGATLTSTGATSDVAPIHNPEFFGNTMVVNGKTWPYLEVEPRKYRFRFLNGSGSRFLLLDFKNKKLKFTQIGTEGGFLPAPVVLDQLLIGNAERADVIVDFSRFNPGDSIILRNNGPDSPFGGLPIPPSEKAHPGTTGQIMQFRVVPLTAPDTSTIPPLPAFTNLGDPTHVRKLSLNEEGSSRICVDEKNIFIPGVLPPDCGGLGEPAAPVAAKLGIVDSTGAPMIKEWADRITENPALGSIELWEIHNFTEDSHPIHVHMVQFQVVNRQDMATGAVLPPQPWETGYKDTVIANPGQITRIKALFDIPGLFVWHCHITEHEDNEMMRSYCVGDMANCQP
jgi:spore coat protein A